MQATVDSYQIQYDDLKKELEETEALYEIGAASQSEADNLKSSVNKAKIQLESAQKQLELNKGSILEDTKKSLQANITQAEASLASAQKQLDDTKVRVEIDGIIGTLNISEGSVVNAQGEAMTLVNMDNLKVSFHVSEDVINEISVGSPVYITVSAVSDDPMTATVTNISEAADSSTRLYQVEAALSNTEGNLKPGMFANVRLVTETKEDTIVVPLNTVLTDNGEKYVFVVDENNIAHKTVVETGLENDTYIEITSGLNIGDTVVTKGQDFLSDGNTVNITNGTTEQESIAEVPEQE
jgi:efflux transporter, RND family, MFP subunit